MNGGDDREAPLTPVDIDRACTGELRTVFQPLVDLWSNDAIAYEALVRFPGSGARTTRDWFCAAGELGLGEKLELAAIASALTHLDEIPASAALSINVSPAVASTEAFRGLVEPFAARLIIELTEHAPIDDHDELAAQLADLRSLGARIAIDDVGAGFAEIHDTFLLEPDIVKLDVSLTSVLESDAVTRALIVELIERAHQTGAEVTAEGIESSEQLAAACLLGIDHGQGYFLGRPAPLEAHLN